MKRENTSEHISIFGYINHLYHYVLNLKIFDQVLPKKKEAIITTTSNTTKQTNEQQLKVKESTNNETSIDLFPKRINYQQDLLSNSTAKPCSMEVSKLNKVINPDGTITWDINPSDHQKQTLSNITSPFLTSTGSTISTHDELSPNGLKFSNGSKDTPSPYNINEQFHKSDEDSTHSLDEIIPDLPHPDFFNISEEERQEQEAEKKLQEEQEQEEQDSPLSDQHHPSSSSTSPKSGSHKIFTCEYCHAEFRIRGYLTRHIKKHAINKAYECPFFNPTSDNKCHPNGGFSRRDTYKTHLKARHFKYPQGTRSQDRPNTPGKCGMCGKNYLNNEDWVEHHIENGECEMLPKGYEGRVKNSRRRNYEFPSTNGGNGNGDDVGSGHSSGNDDNLMSPNTQDGSPPNGLNHNNLLSQFQHPQQVVGGGNKNEKIISMAPVVVGNDYDENDEFSLDTEQVYSYYRY